MRKTNLADVLIDELSFLSSLCYITNRDWYIDVLAPVSLVLYTYESTGRKYTWRISFDFKNYKTEIVDLNGFNLRYESSDVSLISLFGYFTTMVYSKTALLGIKYSNMFPVFKNIIRRSYGIQVSDDSKRFSIYSNLKDVWVADGEIDDGLIYVSAYDNKPINSPAKCYEFIKFLNHRTAETDSNLENGNGYVSSVFYKLVDASTKGMEFFDSKFNCTLGKVSEIEIKGVCSVSIVSPYSDIYTLVCYCLHYGVWKSGLNLSLTPDYRPWINMRIGDWNNSDNRLGTEQGTEVLLDKMFQTTEVNVNSCYDLLFTAMQGIKINTDELNLIISNMKWDKKVYEKYVSQDKSCSVYIDRINTILSQYDYYMKSGMLDSAIDENVKTNTLMDDLINGLRDASINGKDAVERSKKAMSKHDYDLPTKEEARKSQQYDEVEVAEKPEKKVLPKAIEDDNPEDILPTKEEARKSQQYDEIEVEEKKISPRVQDLIDGEVIQVDVRRLIYNGKTIAYRFKTNLGYFDMSVEAADKHGLSQGSVHFDKGILVNLKNGLYVTNREINARRLVREVSDSDICCEKLVNAVFTV